MAPPPRSALALALVLAAPVAAHTQPARCAPPRVPVVVLWTGGIVSAEPQRPTLRCLPRAEYERMRRARGGWRCTPPRGSRPAHCTAINVPSPAR